MTGMGHEEWFPTRRLNGRCRFSQGPSPARTEMGEMRRKGSSAICGCLYSDRGFGAAHASPRRIMPSFSSTYCPAPAWIVLLLISRSTFG